jgi:hypothetical protein
MSMVRVPLVEIDPEEGLAGEHVSSAQMRIGSAIAVLLLPVYRIQPPLAGVTSKSSQLAKISTDHTMPMK